MEVTVHPSHQLHLKTFCYVSTIFHKYLQLDMIANKDHVKAEGTSSVFNLLIGQNLLLYIYISSVCSIFIKIGHDCLICNYMFPLFGLSFITNIYCLSDYSYKCIKIILLNETYVEPCVYFLIVL